MNLNELMAFHRKTGKLATLMGVHMPTTFGIVEADEGGSITSFREKPVLPGRINGGYFVFERKIFDYIENDDTVLENKPFKTLVGQHQIAMFRFGGFWHCMDTFKDYQTLNELWRNQAAPWRVW